MSESRESLSLKITCAFHTPPPPHTHTEVVTEIPLAGWWIQRAVIRCPGRSPIQGALAEAGEKQDRDLFSGSRIQSGACA